MKPREITSQFLSDIYRGLGGEIVLVSALSPFRCEVVPVLKLADAAKKIDFTKELFFSVASYKAGVVQKSGKGRGKGALSGVEILHFDFDKRKFDDPSKYFQAKGFPEPSYAFTRADRFHVYYLLSEPCTDMQDYEQTLKRLAKLVSADVLPAHPAALMRVPFTAHKKKGKTGPGYTPVISNRKRYPLSTFKNIGAATKQTEPGSPEAQRPAGDWLEKILLKSRAKIEPGAGRSSALYQFALRCRDFDMDERQAQGLARRFNELYCEPPEASPVVVHQVSSAYRYAKHPPGRYLSEKPERQALKFEADCKISENLADFVFIAEAEILINVKNGLRYTKAAQIENAICAATGVKTSLQYALTFRLIALKDRLAFRPDEEPEFLLADVSYFNTFEKVRLIEKTKVRKADVSTFEKHLQYLTNNDEEFEHLRKWLACALLLPGQKIKHALLLISTHEGIGKSALEALSKNILCSVREQSYVIQATNTEIARGNNSWIESKFLTFVHELGQSEKYAVMDQLKNWITEPRVRISDKYVRSYEIENFCNFVFYSNAVNALPISGTDRRFFIVVNRKVPMEAAYYQNLFQTFDEGVYSIVDYLGKHAGKLDVNAPPPVTASKLELRNYSKNELTIFLDECLSDSAYKDFFSSGFTIRALAERIQDSAHASNIRFSQKQAAMWLRENNYFVRELHQDGRHVRLYKSDNVVRGKFKEGKK